MKNTSTITALIILFGAICFGFGATFGGEREKAKTKETPVAAAVAISNIDPTFRDKYNSIYVPLTMSECSTICAKEAQGESGLSTKGAGNALDNTSAWPKQAKYVACYGNEGQLWIYQKDGEDEWDRVSEPVSPDATVYLDLWDPKKR